MKINLKVRGRNLTFWVSVVLSVVAPVLAYFGISGADLTTWPALGDLIIRAVSNPYVVGTMLVALYNAIIDPTTSGIGDSIQAQGYTTPKKD